MVTTGWMSDNFIEVFGALAGIIYVILEVKQNKWLWPVGIVTSAVYIWVFFSSRFYADMSLQGYYLVISCMGWYWWTRGSGLRAQGSVERNEGEKGRRGEGEKKEGEKGRGGEGEKKELKVTKVNKRTALILVLVFLILYVIMWLILSKLTDSPVPEWDSFITSLSIVATWMLARKIYEHWLLWIVVNSVSVIIFMTRGLYPTVILYFVYCIMSFIGLVAWKRSMKNELNEK